MKCYQKQISHGRWEPTRSIRERTTESMKPLTSPRAPPSHTRRFLGASTLSAQISPLRGLLWPPWQNIARSPSATHPFTHPRFAHTIRHQLIKHFTFYLLLTVFCTEDRIHVGRHVCLLCSHICHWHLEHNLAEKRFQNFLEWMSNLVWGQTATKHITYGWWSEKSVSSGTNLYELESWLCPFLCEQPWTFPAIYF